MDPEPLDKSLFKKENRVFAKMAQGTNLVVVVLEPLNGLLVANPLEGFLGRLEVGVELSDQVAQGMLQHSARKLTFIGIK
jgi:hypothetical protein